MDTYRHIELIEIPTSISAVTAFYTQARDTEDRCNTHFSEKVDQKIAKRNKVDLEKTFGGIHWLTQTHGITCIEANSPYTEGDAIYTQMPGQLCSVRTADCLPVLCIQTKPLCVIAIHAGWRGLHQNIFQHALAHLPGKSSDIHALIGPHITQKHYSMNPDHITQIIPKKAKKYVAHDHHVSLSGWCRYLLEEIGISHIDNIDVCTYESPKLCSYRKGDLGNFTTGIMINTTT